VKKLLSIIFALALVVGTVSVASAQLGDTDVSSFAVQNLGTAPATVSATFYNESGTPFTPNSLDCNLPAGEFPNPFTLDPQKGVEVVMSVVCEVPDGRYSVVIESTEPVAVTANLKGMASNFSLNGSYSGYDAGSGKVYMPAIYYDYFGWFSLVSVQNTTPDPVNVDVKYYVGDTHVATHSATSVPGFSAVHFDWETNPATPETGQSLPAPDTLPLSAVVEATGDVVAIDNQTIPDTGNMISYNGFLDPGTEAWDTVYIPSLFSSYYGWFSSFLVQNIDDVATTVTVTFNDGCQEYIDMGDWGIKTSSFTLEPKQAKGLMFLPDLGPGSGAEFTCHPQNVAFGATVTSTGANIAAIVNGASWPDAQSDLHDEPVQALAYNGFNNSAMDWGLPNVFQKYYGWDTAFSFQNVHPSQSTVVTITYSENTNPWGTAYPGCTFTYTLGGGENKEYQVWWHHDNKPAPHCDVIPDTYQGNVTLASASQPIVATANLVNFGEQTGTGGDWVMSYNGFVK